MAKKDPGGLALCVDTDSAGCRVARRSTSGGIALRGQHCIRHWSQTQAIIALSSGEAELGGLAKGIAQAHPLRRIGNAQDFAPLSAMLMDNQRSGWITGAVINVDGGRSSLRTKG